MKSNLAAPAKIKDRVTIRSSNSEYIPERIKGRVLKRDLYTYLPWVRKILWRRKWQPTLVSLPGKSHGQRSLAGHSPWGRRVRCDSAAERKHKELAAGFPQACPPFCRIPLAAAASPSPVECRGCSLVSRRITEAHLGGWL